MAYRPNPAHCVFANKVLLEHSHTQFFTSFPWLFSCYNGRAATMETIRPKILILWPFAEKAGHPLV